MKYIALLRGINAGGKRRVPMAELRKLFAENGFSEVSSYINSGNLIFSSPKRPTNQQISKMLEDHFGFVIQTLVLSASEFAQIADAIPENWQNDYVEHKSDVCFLFASVDSPEIIEQIKPKPEIETIIYTKGAVLSNISRKNQSKSSLAGLVGTPLYAQMTVRNITTVKKLARLL